MYIKLNRWLEDNIDDMYEEFLRQSKLENIETKKYNKSEAFQEEADITSIICKNPIGSQGHK